MACLERHIGSCQKSKQDDSEIKHALIKAYRTDTFVAFEQFIMHWLRPEKTVDEFLTDLQQLAWQIGEMPPECWMKSAFINGPSSHIRGILQLSTRTETLTLRELLERACAVLVDTRDEHLAATVWPEHASHTLNLHKTGQSDVTYFRCGGLNHQVRDCMQRSSVRSQRERSTMHCYLCNKTGHRMKNCPGNGNRCEMLAPLSPHSN